MALRREDDEKIIAALNNAAGSLNKSVGFLEQMGVFINRLKEGIDELNHVIRKSSKSADDHNKTVRRLTWALASFTAVQALVVVIPLVRQEKPEMDFLAHVEQKIFDECFDYYASSDAQAGIHITTVQTCKEKAEKYIKDIK